jgi:hypothetical protein
MRPGRCAHWIAATALVAPTERLGCNLMLCGCVLLDEETISAHSHTVQFTETYHEEIRTHHTADCGPGWLLRSDCCQRALRCGIGALLQSARPADGEARSQELGDLLASSWILDGAIGTERVNISFRRSDIRTPLNARMVTCFRAHGYLKEKPGLQIWQPSRRLQQWRRSVELARPSHPFSLAL